MKYIKVTKRGYIKRYLRIYSVNAKGVNKLSNTEVNILTEILFHNTGKTSSEYTSPFNGEGRKEILINLNNLAETTFSSNLKKLSKKGFLIPLGKKGEYAIATFMLNLMNELHTSDKMNISYTFNIIPEIKEIVDEKSGNNKESS